MKYAWIIALFSTVTSFAQDTPIRFEFSGQTTEANQVTIIGAGFDTLPKAAVTFSAIPTDNAFEDATDGHGIIISAQPGEGVMIFPPVIETDKAAVIQCSVRANTPHASVYLATIDQGEDVFISTVTPNNGALFMNQYQKFSCFSIPPSTSGFQPLIQVVNTSETETLTVYLDRFDVYLLESDRYYNEELINGDEVIPKRLSLSETDFAEGLQVTADESDPPISIEFSYESAEREEITVMGAGFDTLPQANVFFSFIPVEESFPTATDGKGAIVIAASGQGVMFIGPQIETSHAAIIRCSVRTNNPSVSVVLAAIDQGPNTFITTNTPNNGSLFLYQYKRLSTFFVPPSTGFQPLIQVVNSGETGSAIVYLDTFEVFLLEPGWFYHGEFLNGGEVDPSLYRISEDGNAESFPITIPLTPTTGASSTPTSAPTLTPTRTPSFTPTPVPPLTPTLTPTQAMSPTFTPVLSPTFSTPVPAPTYTPSSPPVAPSTSTPAPTSTLAPTLSPTPYPTSEPTEPATPAPKEITLDVPNLPTNVKPLEMVLIPRGEFLMGSPETEKDRYDDEGPQHWVTITHDFYLGKYEVTNAQFRAYNPNFNSRDYDGIYLDGEDQPVVYVNWKKATGFCKWLTEETGRQFRLPTEAEWEYASRAGTVNRRYWGDDPNDELACAYANIADLTTHQRYSSWTVLNCEDGYLVTAPVGFFEPNDFGLYDMLGNVFEWCEDWYDEDYYSRSPSNDPINNESGEYRILRGGGWFSRPRSLRAAYRSGYDPEDESPNIGFRVAMSVD